jgi:hypothetical protein
MLSSVSTHVKQLHESYSKRSFSLLMMNVLHPSQRQKDEHIFEAKSQSSVFLTGTATLRLIDEQETTLLHRLSGYENFTIADSDPAQSVR